MNSMLWRGVEMKKTTKLGQLLLKMVVTTWSQSGSTWGLVSGRTGTRMTHLHQRQGDSVVKPVKACKQFRAELVMAIRLPWMVPVLQPPLQVC